MLKEYDIQARKWRWWRTEKAQISICIAQSLFCSLIHFTVSNLSANSEDSDQMTRVYRLIWVFAVRKWHIGWSGPLLLAYGIRAFLPCCALYINSEEPDQHAQLRRLIIFGLILQYSKILLEMNGDLMIPLGCTCYLDHYCARRWGFLTAWWSKIQVQLYISANVGPAVTTVFLFCHWKQPAPCSLIKENGVRQCFFFCFFFYLDTKFETYFQLHLFS